MILDRRGVCCHRNSTYELDGLCSACLNSKRDFMLAAICSQLKGFRPLFHLRPMAKYNGSYFSYALDMLIHFRVSFCNRTLSEVYRWCVRIIYIYYIYINTCVLYIHQFRLLNTFFCDGVNTIHMLQNSSVYEKCIECVLLQALERSDTYLSLVLGKYKQVVKQ